MKYFKRMKFNTCQCFNCQSNILNDEIYNCNICKRFYCSECFMIDNHLKEYIPNKNLYYNEKKPNIKKIKFNIRMLENEYRKIIKSICEWEEELKYKLNFIKYNLKKEIQLIKNIIYNFNYKSFNKKQWNNINYLDHYLDTIYNKFLIEFIKAKTLNEKGKYIFELFDIIDSKDNNNKKKGIIFFF